MFNSKSPLLLKLCPRTSPQVDSKATCSVSSAQLSIKSLSYAQYTPPTRRDATVELSRVGGVYWALHFTAYNELDALRKDADVTAE